ncbi:response regulator [Maridesulfovibrio bastinii]|uniref:response regulator n=1 Tax=Maridesulfovibrio bastinii TaxID=47157 RepID=UPI00041F5509|nr:response regulator [Maridesulfovibrio bastinii]
MNNSSKKSVTIITASTEHAQIDKSSLLKHGLSTISQFNSGQEAFDHIKRTRPRLCIVDSQLDDMDGCALIRKLKSNRTTRMIPVMMITINNLKDHVLDAIAAGCAAYVIRPYAPATFERHLKYALSSIEYEEIEAEMLDHAIGLVADGFFDEAIEELEELTPVENDAVKYFDIGTHALLERKYGKAIIAFNKALKFNQMYAEAYQGLAEAHKGKGNEERYQEYLSKAADIYALQDRLQEAKDIYVKILKNNPDAMNPYNSLGVKLRKKGDYDGALHAYKQALELSPRDENLRYNIAKAYLFANDREAAIGHLKEALKIKKEFKEARDLLHRLHADMTEMEPSAIE